MGFSSKHRCNELNYIQLLINTTKIVKMVYPFYLKNNPEGACDKLIAEANLAWKRVLYYVIIFNYKTETL